MFNNVIKPGFFSSVKKALKIASESVSELHSPKIQNASTLSELHAINQNILKLEQAVKTLQIKLESEKSNDSALEKYTKYFKKLQNKKSEFDARYKQVIREPNQEVLDLDTSSNHYHPLFLKLKEAKYLILFKERLQMIRHDHFVVSRLRSLFRDLAENRIEVLLVTSLDSINLASFPFIFSRQEKDISLGGVCRSFKRDS